MIMRGSGKMSSSNYNSRVDQSEFAYYSAASSKEPFSGGRGLNKDDIANKDDRILDATANAQDIDVNDIMEMSRGLVRSRSRSPSLGYRWDTRVDVENNMRVGGGRGGGERLCRYFALGKCYRGNHCRFLHQYQKNQNNFEQGARPHAINQNDSAVVFGTPFSSDMKESNWTTKNVDAAANVHTSQPVMPVSVDNLPDNEKMSPPNWNHGSRSSSHISKEQQVPPCNYRLNIPLHHCPLKKRDPRCFCKLPKNDNANESAEGQLVKNEHSVQLQKGENVEVDEENTVVAKEKKSSPCENKTTEEKNSLLENRDQNSGPEPDETSKINDAKRLHAFKFSLVEFVKELLKPTWKDGKLAKEDYKTIVKRITDKVISTLLRAHVPQTQERIDAYLSASKQKLNKLVQAYVEKFQKA